MISSGYVKGSEVNGFLSIFTSNIGFSFRLNPNSLKICQQFPRLQDDLCAKIHAKISSQHSSLRTSVQNCFDKIDELSRKCEVILTKKAPQLDLSELANDSSHPEVNCDPVNHPDLSTLLKNVRDLPYDLGGWKKQSEEALIELESAMAQQGSPGSKSEKLNLDDFPEKFRIPDALRERLSDVIESSKFLKAS